MEHRFEIFTTRISKITRNIRKIKSNAMAEYDLKSTHVNCIYYLYAHNNELTAKELCDLCEEDKGAISRAIDDLENMNYIVCNCKTEKRYKSPLSLTESGIKVGKYIANKINNVLDEASEGLSEENRKIFYDSLQLISDNLQKICDKIGG